MPPGQLPEYTFDELGGSIGRKPNNDFVLIDPERFISSQHANIGYQGGAFFITDTSTNGVFINHSQNPIGTGNTQAINNGDKISIGEFQFQAILSEPAPLETPWLESNTASPAEIPSTTADDIFDFNEPLVIDNTSSDSLNEMDPLALLGGTGDNFQPQQDFASTPLTPHTDDGNSQFFDDILQSPHQNIPEPLPINEPFTPPSAIPDDWDIMGDDIPVHASPTLAPSTPPFAQNSPSAELQKEPPEALPEAIIPPHPDSMFPDTLFESTTPLIPDTGDLIEDDDIFASLAKTAQPLQTAPSTQAPIQPAPDFTSPIAPTAVPPATKPREAARPTSAQSTAPATINDRELLDAFIKGAGLDPSRIQADDPITLLTKLGQLTRISTEGLMMALRARATIKSSFRVNKTIIAPIENNPLKFSVTSEDALNIIFADEKAGYMSATEAFSEGFKDLQTHQMAMMAGMQAVIKEITEQFSPDTLTRNFESQKTGSSFIPSNKKAKNWEMYEEYYKKMTATLQDDFQNLYGEEFARAYEDQIRKLL